jgi:hypothetical protein
LKGWLISQPGSASGEKSRVIDYSNLKSNDIYYRPSRIDVLKGFSLKSQDLPLFGISEVDRSYGTDFSIIDGEVR